MKRSEIPKKPETVSFVIQKKYLNEEQLEAIRDNKNSGFEHAIEHSWEITENGHYITGWTYLDHFDIDLLFEKINVEWKHIVWGQ